MKMKQEIRICRLFLHIWKFSFVLELRPDTFFCILELCYWRWSPNARWCKFWGSYFWKTHVWCFVTTCQLWTFDQGDNSGERPTFNSKESRYHFEQLYVIKVHAKKIKLYQLSKCDNNLKISDDDANKKSGNLWFNKTEICLFSHYPRVT
jgi:hypothetical protein